MSYEKEQDGLWEEAEMTEDDIIADDQEDSSEEDHVEIYMTKYQYRSESSESEQELEPEDYRPPKKKNQSR